MELPKDFYLEQLYTATPTEENMKSLAIYIRTFKHDHMSAVAGIEYVYRRAAIHHRLCLLYLVNEILQTEKSQSGLPLKAELLSFLRRHFLADRDLSSSDAAMHRKFQSLQSIWRERCVIDFDDKFGLDEIVTRIYKIFNNKSELVDYFDEVSRYYRSK